MADREPGPVIRDSAGLLRERLAAQELASVRAIGERDGVPALLEHAIAMDRRAVTEEKRLAELALALEREPARTAAVIEAFLRETATDGAQLRGDLRSLRRHGDKRLNLAALAERTAVRVFRAELECEVALALLRAGVREANVSLLRSDALVALALRPGRWSRRVEALAVLRALTRYPLATAATVVMVAACVELAKPGQHRWIQTPAVEVLVRLAPARALDIVRTRFDEARAATTTRDDFLVRERFIALAARLRRSTWHEVIERGAEDPSEHVRIAAARAERDQIRLTHIATSASSEKVRATALVALTKRTGSAAEPILAGALVSDASPLVAQVAASSLALLAQRKVLQNRKAARDALERAATRADLPERARAAVLEELLAVAVLGDSYLRLVHDLLVKVLEKVPIGDGVRLEGKLLDGITDEQMGHVLSVIARTDFALSADRISGGFMVYRGEQRVFAPWRWLFELRNPLPTKRQGYSHTWGRKMRGRLRAPPHGLAELTATSVPGERVLVAKRGDWGRHLPLVDDLVHSDLLAGRATHVVGSSGTTVITPPASIAGRLVALLKLSMRYARFAEQRRRSLDSDEDAVQRGYLETVARETGIRMEFIPHGFAPGLPPPSELQAPGSAPGPNGSALFALAPLAQALDGVVRDVLHYAVRPEGNRLPHVGAYAATVLVAMVARGVVIRRRIDADRKAIPLVVGGWGSRGKSGTARLKAGLFQGLGYETLVKTTGCEAMFIHAIPGLQAHEVFIYRPYDKATVWEQRGLLALGRRFGVRVFLWECMALQPDLVNLLQAQWMRDDYSTITNAYPDHEDVMGPSGYDVGQVISEFVPPGGRLFTTEDQMLPLLREAAKAKGTSIRAVGEREAALLGDDVLARFPYHEHPKNIALVCALAQALGVPAAVALAEMADNVVPDLGVLKTYPRVAHAGRSLAFTNGMSANERTGALSNWVRMGFDLHDSDQEPARWVVTVVNNRADRVARSEVFARFLVQDIGAHKHFLIGTNVVGLVGFLREALDKHIAQIAPSLELEGDAKARRTTVDVRLERAFKKLKIGAPTPSSVASELAALKLPPLDHAVLEELLAPASSDETLTHARRAIDAKIPSSYPAEARPFVIATLARRRMRRVIVAAVDAFLDADPKRLDTVFAKAYRALFEDQIVALNDATLTGDQIIDTIATHCPPGARIDVMGLQNIKGTGLDFVYRWVSLEAVDRALTKAVSTSSEDVSDGLRALLVHDDYGLVDSVHALAVIAGRRASASPEHAGPLDAVVSRLGAIATRRKSALSAKRSRSAGDVVRGVIGKTFDYLDSMRRQALAREVLEDLVAGRVSHAGAAVEMRAVVARAKGAWAARKATDS